MTSLPRLAFPHPPPPIQMWTQPNQTFFARLHEARLPPSVAAGIPEGLCWDANTVAIGSKLSLEPCSDISPTQIFQHLVFHHHGMDTLAVKNRLPPELQQHVASMHDNMKYHVLSIAVDEHTHLCAELTFMNDVRLQPCRKDHPYQLFNFYKTTTVKDLTVCVGLSAPTTDSKSTYIIRKDCAPTASLQFPYVKNSPRVVKMTEFTPRVVKPNSITTIMIGDKCLDGSDENLIRVTKCIPYQPSQKWYYAFGHIRNVENGLCLTQVTSLHSYRIVMRKCRAYGASRSSVDIRSRTTYLWIREPSSFPGSNHEHTLRNGESGLCLSKTYDGNDAPAEILGLSPCDLAHGPIRFKNLDSFAMQESSFIHETSHDRHDQDCTTTKFRQDLRSLSPNQRNLFFATLNSLHHIPSLLGYPSLYTDFAVFYYISRPWILHQPFFLPWMRLYLIAFENTVRHYSGDPTFMLPYWSWGIVNRSWYRPGDGDVLSPHSMGMAFIHGGNACIPSGNGFMSHAWKTIGIPCIQRGYSYNGGGGSVNITTWNERWLMEGLESRSSFSEMDKWLVSTVHDGFSNAIGGIVRNFELTPDDPLFWLHVGNIDRLHLHWQKTRESVSQGADISRHFEFEGERPSNLDPSKKRATVDDILPGFNVPVARGLEYDIGNMCYQYEAFNLPLH